MIELERLGLAWEINGAEITWSFFSCSAWKEGNQEDEKGKRVNVALTQKTFIVISSIMIFLMVWQITIHP